MNLESHFKDIQTLPGTRSFHSLQPKNEFGMIEARRISSDVALAITFNLCNKQQTCFVKIEDSFPGCFIACIYGNLWYFGMVSEVNVEEDDVTVKLLHPHGPSVSFFWPQREDACAILITHDIAIVKPPKTMTGRTYQISQKCMIHVQTNFKNTVGYSSSIM